MTTDAPCFSVSDDAELIRLGTEFKNEWKKERVATAAAPEHMPDNEFSLLWKPCLELAEQIFAFRATTMVGIKIKAETLAWCCGGLGSMSEETTYDRLLNSMLRDLLTANDETQADCKLLRLAVDLEAAFSAHKAREADGTADDADFQPIYDAARAIAQEPATSITGLAVKARALACLNDGDLEDEPIVGDFGGGTDARLALDIARGVLALADPAGRAFSTSSISS
ncbi:hypothetical protein GJ654_04300 [Rhodoblastus acidophilus]|uniref:Uncharacterized protein n=1 Tax=Rhodoblastus acidophilus TaxID=1074 RepID=A0A6N8DIB3_RHOAC|nr:hypothetical protein [Rhodoblastus acidophilus]MCW2273318.1 dihydroneopterin aldolase [Rhodoblastus acidophilus]MTV30210.1 hypothetical protein [Rhodoblastus acidophilus]